MRRREAREFVLATLYQREFVDAPLDEVLAETDPGDQRGYIEQTLSGIAENKARIDEEIARRTVDWRFERLALVDRNILRLGVYELLYLGDIPPEVALDEAVELCKKYGTENARVFVNGILDRIWKEKRQGADTGREADRPQSAEGSAREGDRPAEEGDLPQARGDPPGRG